jgi:hypothetical protein
LPVPNLKDEEVKMIRILFSFGMVLLLTACASPPLYVRFDDGKLLQGTGMNGRYTIRDVDGFSCSGSYPIMFIMPTFEIPMNCSDGRTSTMLMTMNPPDYDSGFGRGVLSDGMKYKAVFGGTTKRQSLPSILKSDPVVKKK